jgi:hypothetical protein
MNIVRTRSGEKLHLCNTGSTHMRCGSSWGYVPQPVRWNKHVKFCARCCSPEGIKLIRAIVSFLTLTEV